MQNTLIVVDYQEVFTSLESYKNTIFNLIGTFKDYDQVLWFIDRFISDSTDKEIIREHERWILKASKQRRLPKNLSIRIKEFGFLRDFIDTLGSEETVERMKNHIQKTGSVNSRLEDKDLGLCFIPKYLNFLTEFKDHKVTTCGGYLMACLLEIQTVLDIFDIDYEVDLRFTF